MAARQTPETLDMSARLSTMEEVDRGLKPHQALAEAGRCIFCHDAPCVKGCPVESISPGSYAAYRNATWSGRPA